jgi:O-antigen ligase
LNRASRGLTLLVGAAALAIVCGWAAANGSIVVLLVLALTSIVTWHLPEVVPAILLVGPGFLHALTYVSVGSAVRGDVLASPVRFLPVLAALFGPPAIRALYSQSSDFRARLFSRRAAGRWIVATMLLLLGVLVLRLFGSSAPIYGETKILGFVAYSVVPAMLVLLTATRRRDAERVLDAMLVIGGAWICLALGIAVARGDLNLYRADPGELLGGTNEAGGGLAARAALVALAGMAGALYTSRRRALRLAVSTTALAMVVLSGHRGTAIALVAGILALMAALYRTRTARRAWYLLLALTVSAGVWVGWLNASPDVQERFLNPFQSTSYKERVEVQKDALEGWLASPLLGNGTGSSAYFIAQTDQPGLGIVNGIYPHNITVELLAEVGVLGAGIFLVGIIGLLMKAWRRLGAQAPRWALPALFAMLAYSFVFAQGFADLTIQNDLWIISALLAIALVSDERMPAMASNAQEQSPLTR